jgi:hypothetical protein
VRRGARQVEQVLPLDVVEPLGLRDRVEHALGSAAQVAALEPGVVHAHPGECRRLLAAQAGHAPVATDVGETRLLGGHLARREIRNCRISSFVVM